MKNAQLVTMRRTLYGLQHLAKTTRRGGENEHFGGRYHRKIGSDGELQAPCFGQGGEFCRIGLFSHKHCRKFPGTTSGIEETPQGFCLLTQQGHGRMSVDRGINRQRDQEGSGRKMFSEEDEHGLIEDIHIAKAVFLRTLALIMKNRRGHITILKAGFQR